MITTQTKRLREIDFLRGAAIVLVLFRHKFLFQFTTTMGWIGVDLFFVLSGFLVSGLLFKEYLRFGQIDPKRFLIRRGFKIYPIYYLFYIPYLIPLLLNDEFSLTGFLSDMVFLQNYVLGWGYAYAASWSLAIEEHFYIGLSLFLWLGIKYKKIRLDDTSAPQAGSIPFSRLMIAILILCVCMRLISNLAYPEQMVRNTTMTHLRIDSLIAGVYISYLFYFRYDRLLLNFKRYKIVLLCVALLFLVWTPFIDPIPSFFVKTIGFTMLYISFGIILLYFVLHSRINDRLNFLFGRPTVDVLSKIGYCSYSIYVIHTLINFASYNVYSSLNITYNHYVDFFAATISAILIGMFMTYIVEDYFLKVRNTYFPNRA